MSETLKPTSEQLLIDKAVAHMRQAISVAIENAQFHERQRWYKYIASLDVDLNERRLQNDILKAIREANTKPAE